MPPSMTLKVPPARIAFTPDQRREILERIDRALQSGQLTLGANGKAFEEAFAKAAGRACAVAVNSGTSSIEIPLRVLGVKGRDVIVPTNTFMATAFGVWHAGGNVRFADIDPVGLGLSARTAQKALTRKTAGVVQVHIGGVISPETPALAEWCRKKGLWLFEDAAHAHGATLGGRWAGSFGVAASYSFYPTKVMTSAEGGMVVTDDRGLAEQCMLYRDQGKQSFTANVHDRLGYNWRMSEPHAAIGLVHLSRLTEMVEERRRIASWYDGMLKDGPPKGDCVTPHPGASAPGVRSNYYKYVAMLPKGVDRAALKKRLREEFSVGLAGEVYEMPCHRQPLCSGHWDPKGFAAAERFCASHVCLPVYNGMTKEEAETVVAALKACLPARRNASR